MTRLEEMARVAYTVTREIAISQQRTDAWLPWEEMQEIDRQRLIAGMRAAIEALKPSNMAMISATAHLMNTNRHWTPRMFWETTLDAILEEK